MKLGFVIVLYNPTTDQIENFAFLSKNWDTVFIDNSEVAAISPPKNYVHVGFGANLARAMNVGFNYLRQMACTHCCYFDQDASLSTDYQSFFNYLDLPSFVSAPQKLASRIRFGSPSVIPIANGCIYNLKTHNDLDGFDENLLIDCVDEDYILKGLHSGCNLQFNEGAYLSGSHEIGALNRVRFLGRTLYFSVHPGWRVQLMFRNRVILACRYKSVFSRYAYICTRDFFGFLFQERKAIYLMWLAFRGVISGVLFCFGRGCQK